MFFRAIDDNFAVAAQSGANEFEPGPYQNIQSLLGLARCKRASGVWAGRVVQRIRKVPRGLDTWRISQNLEDVRRVGARGLAYASDRDAAGPAAEELPGDFVEGEPGAPGHTQRRGGGRQRMG